MTALRRTLRCVFRVAAGPRLGFGHLMRARALAQALGVEPRVSIRGGVAARRAARAAGCRPIADTAKALAGADVLVVDDPSPAHMRTWLTRGRRHGLACVAIQDGGDPHDADLVIDGSGRQSARPAARGARPLLAGLRYYVLDPRVAMRRRSGPHDRRNGVARVLVALGGGHHVRRFAHHLVDALHAHCPRASVQVAAGFTRGPRKPLRHARWLTARKGLVDPLSAADVAIVAGGVTLYEACALGVPTIGLAVVPAQRRAIRAFAAHRAVIDAGGPGTAAVVRAARGAAGLLENPQAGRQRARAAQLLVDGKGADRVARAIRAVAAARRARS